MFSILCDDCIFLAESFTKGAGITDNDTYAAWKENSREVIYDAKNLHFDPRVIFVDVAIPTIF